MMDSISIFGVPQQKVEDEFAIRRLAFYDLKDLAYWPFADFPLVSV